MIKICKHCGIEFETQKNGTTRQYCYNCSPMGEQLTGNILHRRMKEWALEYKGKKCQRCGYNNSISALEFHHLNPSEKDFSLSDKTLSREWNVIKNELDKCILVCANCHRELHESEYQNSSIVFLEEKIVDNSKRVRCITTGEIFGSCQIAGSYFGITSASHIKEVCRGERNYCGRHPKTNEPLDWEWVDINPEEQEYFKRKKQQCLENTRIANQKRINKTRDANSIQVKCSTGEIFNSIKEAADWCHLAPPSIARALKNENFTAGQHPTTKERLHWYKIKGDDYIDIPKE